ncbi:hypothetical protein [Burkholderia stagnalis]|uniref:hypothetical protein n=1 Tax=Burkholderia stagnalis TaxID=1503054 RepID=UPI00163AD654|nr:hypothetical protein [Burkholderia stagnalis]
MLDLRLRAMNREIELTTADTNVEYLVGGPHDGIGLLFTSAVLTVGRYSNEVLTIADISADSSSYVHARIVI